MTVYIFAEMVTHDPEGYAEYPPRIIPLIEKHGDRLMRRMGAFEIEREIASWCGVASPCLQKRDSCPFQSMNRAPHNRR